MAILLHIETSTTNCSVSISKDDKVVALVEQNDAGYSHAENLHLFILKTLQSAGLDKSELDAVVVSKGPGSYTGLRIGVSTAKGICFALDKPLIAVETLEVLARQYSLEDVDNNKQVFIVPMLDARRMEVYSAVFNNHYKQIRETEAEIIDSNSFSEYLNKGKVYFIGDGAQKCKGVIEHPNAVFQGKQHYPSANEMAQIASLKYKAGEFENLAYFEPYYLKDFIGQKKKS